jgi:hypothetical protein
MGFFYRHTIVLGCSPQNSLFIHRIVAFIHMQLSTKHPQAAQMFFVESNKTER